MDHLNLYRAPSVGGLVKKIMEINPELGTAEVIAIIRKATQTRGGGSFGDGLGTLEVVDEAVALELARATAGTAR